MDNQPKRKILFVTTSYPRYSGDIAGSFFVPLIEKLKVKYDITVLAPDDPLVEKPDTGVKRYRYCLFRNWQQLTYSQGMPENLTKSPLVIFQVPLLFFSMLFQMINIAMSCDVIITNWLLPSGLAGAITSWITKKPHITIEHSAGVHTLLNLPAKELLLDFILCHTAKLVLVSPYLLKILSTILPEKQNNIDIIPMGIDLNQFDKEINRSDLIKTLNIPANNNIVLFMGRLVDIKGLDILIKSLEGIDNVTLIVAGSGQKRTDYEDLAKNLNISALFLGNVAHKDKIDILKLADVVVIPSLMLHDNRTEGSPLIVMEAMAAEKIVIASNIGGISYMIDNDTNGKLFNPADVEELHNLLLDVFNNKHFYYKLAKEAKTSAQNYDIEKVGQYYLDLIDKVIDYG